MEKLLNSTNLIFPILLYLFSSIFDNNPIFSIFRHVLFLSIISVIIFKPFYKNIETLREKGFIPYYFLYFASIFLFIQNTLLIAFHSIDLRNYSDSDNISSNLQIIDSASSFYHIAIIIDIYAMILFLGYFLTVKVGETKEQVKVVGRISIIFFLFITILWRSLSGFFNESMYSTWFEDNYSGIIQLLFLLSQIIQIIFWYSFGILNRVKFAKSHAFLDNKIDPRNSIYETVIVIIAFYLIFLLSQLIYLNIDYTAPLGSLVSFGFAVKVILLPISFCILHLNIFRRYNLIF